MQFSLYRLASCKSFVELCKAFRAASGYLCSINQNNVIHMYEILRLVNEMSPYLLLGFFVAGLLHVFVPGSLYSRYLSGANLRSVLLAALFGIPLPLCSCGVIPTAMSLRKEGASKGATTSFLIATPQTGVDSIFATYSILGLPFAILRPIAALVTSVFGGLLVNAADKDREKAPQTADTDCADGEVCARQEPAYTGFVDRMKGALRYGFVDMVQDIGKWLVIGLVVAGLITLFVPDDFFVRFADRPLLAYVVVLLIAIPMYVCATGSIPVAAALMLKGLSPGAALVFLMAGPASNMASILVIRRVMGQRTLWIYLLSLTVGAIVFGLGVDFLLPRELFTSLLSPTDACCHMGTPWWQWASTVVMGALLLYALVIAPLLHRRTPETAEAAAAENGTAPRRFVVEGMTCHHCCTHVEKALQSVPGVTHAEVSLERGEALVEGDATDDALMQAVADIGYTLRRP